MAMALTGGLGSPASAAPFYVAQTGYQERQTSRSLCGSKGGWFLEVYRIMVTPANGDIYARLVKANGTLGPLAGIELTGTHSGNPCAAYGPDTNLFGVVWEQGPAVRFRLVQPPTAAMSADFIVAAPLAVGEVCRSPAIAYLGNGCFLVVWVLELDGDRVAHARVVKADCTMTSPRPLHSSGLADHPAVASAGWGGGVAVWEHEHMAAGAQTDIVARSVSASGAVLGANPTALTKTAAEERRPQIAASPAVGTCLAVWESLAWPQPLTARYLDA
jgi:hypothetical protein